MWGAAIIVFREVFEIAIIMSVVLAATKTLKDRGKWIGLGIIGGIFGAILFAAVTESLTLLAGTAGKLYVNAGLLLMAVIMIGWTVVWMKQHGKSIVSDMKQMSHAITLGDKPHYLLAIIIGLAVLREGSEAVVFVYGLIAADQATWLSGLLGSLIGLSMGALFGLLLYHGLLRISVKYLFQIPSILLTLIASGMAANAAGKLVEAHILPALIHSVWDTSSLLPQHGILGKFLFILIGYQDHPNGMQVLCYFLTLMTIFLIARRKAKLIPY